MGIDAAGRLQRIETDLINHVPSFTGEIWYVSKSGSDSVSGEGPDRALLTIGAAITAASAGDAIVVQSGTYTESIDMNLVGLEMWGEIGATIAGTLTISANNCRVREMIVSPAAAVGVVLTGSYCKVEDTHVIGTPTTAFDVDGIYNIVQDCKVVGHTVSAFNIAASRNHLYRCLAHGANTATRGFYLSNAAADTCYLEDCSSISNTTTGFELVSGVSDVILKRCASGGGDGDRVDGGHRNFWPSYVDRRQRESHEHIYPYSTGQGDAGDPVTVNNTTTDGAGGTREDQNYWGDIKVLVSPDTIATSWYCLGLYIHAETAADIQQWQLLFTDDGYVSAQNGGNDWDENETILTVADGSIFQTDDLVWIVGNDRTQGEIQKVSSVAVNAVTIVRETTADGEAGLRYNYDGDPSANKMYLVYRSTDREFHGYMGDHETGSTRDWVRIDFCKMKLIFANGGMLIRMLNATDAQASSFDVRAIWMD